MNRERRFAEGNTAEFSGVKFRVCKGRKAPQDLVLEWRTAQGWVPVSAAALFYMVDFIAENEDFLYPVDESGQGRGPMGGEYIMAKLRAARVRGWVHAAKELRLERERRRMKAENGVSA